MRVLFYIRASCFCVCDLVCFCVLSGEEGAHPPRLFVCRVVIRCVGHLYYALTCIRSSHARTTYLATRALHSLSNTHSFTIARPLCATHAPHSRSLWLPSPRQHTSLPSSLFTHSSLSFTHLSQRPSASPMSSVAFDRVYTPRPIVATTTVSEVGSYERPPIRTRGRSLQPPRRDH